MILLNEIMCKAAYIMVTFHKHGKNIKKGRKVSSSHNQMQMGKQTTLNFNIKCFVCSGSSENIRQPGGSGTHWVNHHTSEPHWSESESWLCPCQALWYQGSYWTSLSFRHLCKTRLPVLTVHRDAVRMKWDEINVYIYPLKHFAHCLFHGKLS